MGNSLRIAIKNRNHLISMVLNAESTNDTNSMNREKQKTHVRSLVLMMVGSLQEVLMLARTS